MDQDSRESAATTIIHRKTQRNEKVKFQKHNNSDWKKNVIFTPPTRNAHFWSVTDGGGEAETLLIRSSMEEDRAYL